VNADRYTKQTDDADIFAGGDAVTGPESLVEATASGKKAAMSIDKFINGQSPEMDDEDAFDDLFKSIKLYDPDEEVKKVEPLERKKPSVLPPETRATNFDEVEAGFATPDAVAEAERCLRCYRAVTLAY
jgi:formate dehydrogenase beta subunit